MNIIIQPNAKKFLSKLPKLQIEQILKKLNSIKEDPLHFVERLEGSPLWKLRAGDHRCILFLNTGKEEIYVISIGHRS